jgi:3-oxoadipate enol-lactonase
VIPAALHVEDSGGSGEVVVLAHAIGCDTRMWEEVTPRLASRYRVLRMDARGHGRSPVTARPYSLAGLAADFAAALERLGVQRAHWVGLSMGGMIGQAFALRHGERLGRLVIANSTSSYGPEGRPNWHKRIRLVEQGGLAAIREMVEQRYFSADFRRDHADIVAKVMGRFMETSPEGYLGCCDAIADLDFSRDLGRIGHRTLVIAGDEDVGTPPAMSEEIVAKIPGSRLAIMNGAAHLSAAEKPEEFSRLLLDFLAAH